ncbi:hypothetical protein GMLC_02510 [Geomonas limicola]|uniref:SsuA/THI5-like domain-containing protein n=1 Tax=Geomonas limicola TaxID=2740186 RepID=A0A6V8N2D2_9BACT|nr:hypothetical protein GMLC_02510 [Geomonas limicola]
MKAVIEGKADIGTVADYPIAMEALKGRKISVIATIARQSRTHSIVALKQYNISSPKDLADKNIGVSLGTNGHFILDSFLLYHKVPEGRVRLVDLTADGMAEALKKGQIQAAILWGPPLARLIRQLGDKAVVFDGDEQQIYTQTWNLVATDEYIRKNPEDVKRVLRALSTACAFIKEHGEESLAIATKYSEMEPGAARETWQRVKLALSLNPLLIENLENEARWAVKKELTSGGQIPNFLDYISFNGLESVAPGEVTIIH